MSFPSKQNKPLPANFLIVPREIRQKILYESFDEACELDVHFSVNVSLLEQILEVRRPIGYFLPYIHKQASILYSIHDTVSGDMEFVVNQVLTHFGGQFDLVWNTRVYCKNMARWHTLATEIGVWETLDEDDEALHHRRFMMVQTIREAIGADTSQFSFDREEDRC